MHAFLLAASLVALTLDDGQVTMSVPTSIHVKKHSVNFETTEFDLYDGNDATPLLAFIDGGGSYDLTAFSKTCLNGSPAWVQDGGASGTTVIGQPGSWAVAAYWTNLNGSRLTDAHEIISSIRINFGGKC
jgi:hypothetical protein